MFLIGALIVYRIGTFIPVPGIDPPRCRGFFRDQASTILGMVNMFSGGALSRLSIFAMGVMPYISASIIVQMMWMVVPHADGAPQGRRVRPPQVTQYTRYFTVGAGCIPVVRPRPSPAEATASSIITRPPGSSRPP